MVTVERVWEALAEIPDPEIPVISLVDLGVVAGVAAIFSIFFFTMIVWLVWLAVSSVVLFMRAGSPARAGEALAPA
jgi:hypothetical protein